MNEYDKSDQEAQRKKQLQELLFTFVDGSEIQTVNTIVEQTSLTAQTVESMLSNLVSNGKVEKDDDKYRLTDETQEMVFTLHTMQTDINRREKFKKYRENPTYTANIKQSEKFDPSHVEASAGNFQFERQLSPHEKAYCFEHKVYLVWVEGPRTGEVFFVKDKLEETDIQTIFSEDFLQNVANFLSQFSQRKRLEVEGELNEYLMSVYFGSNETLGWEEARYYDLDGEGEKINQLMKAMLEKGLKNFLLAFSREKGIDISYSPDLPESAIMSLFYDGMEREDLNRNRWKNTDQPIMLTHGTYSHILPNLIQMGGLASKKYFESFGIKKYYGGESHGSGAYTPNDISFWYHEDGKPLIHGGHGSQRAYDFPMKIGITKEKAEQLHLNLGSMSRQEELVVKDFVPMEFITHIFVPGFKVDEVKAMFNQNGIENIQVLPLRQS